MDLRNLIITPRRISDIMLLGTLGLRTSTLTALNIEDVDFTYGTVWVKEKGRIHRSMVLPQSLCKIISNYLQLRCQKKCRCLRLNVKTVFPRVHYRIFSAQWPMRSILIKNYTLGFFDIPHVISYYTNQGLTCIRMHPFFLAL